jgi:hypothetical protein
MEAGRDLERIVEPEGLPVIKVPQRRRLTQVRRKAGACGFAAAGSR